MKSPRTIALANWLLQHLTLGSPNESLAGDLFEELQSGRSKGWYWRQVLSAIATSVSIRFRAYLLPLGFSVAWSFVYSAGWPSIMRGPLTQAATRRLATHDWPYSTGFHAVAILLPAILFVWFGLFLYLASRTNRPPALRLVASLSISLNALLLSTIALHLATQQPVDDRLSYQSLSLALSLFSALICALQPARQLHHASPAA
ncbi:hypothetical protein [Granulicella arctica]|uniref:hypothetical protein n=1 Tax=Granulicella arctica TaxID=940613 RepID=UPI0021DFFC51|nr:hypothetical protein [Granulicella arctica]